MWRGLVTTMDESRPYRPHKKPRICQRCRTHGDEQLSTSEHRLACPFKDCKCSKCQTIQRENLRHSEYNRRRRAERREKATFFNNPYNMSSAHASSFPLQSPQQPTASGHHPMYVVVADGQNPGPAAAPSHYVPPHLRSFPMAASHVPSTSYMQRPQQLTPTSYTPAAYSAQPSPPSIRNPGHPGPPGPSFYATRTHQQPPPQQPPPQVTLGRPYAANQVHASSRLSFVSSGLTEHESPSPIKRRHDVTVDLGDRESPTEPPLKLARRRDSIESQEKDVFEQNGNGNGHSPRHPPVPVAMQSESNSASSETGSPLAMDDELQVGGGAVRTSPPPLQATEHRVTTSDDSPTNLPPAAGTGAMGREAGPARPTMLRTNTVLPWDVRDPGKALAQVLVQLLDSNPGVDYHMAYTYLAACSGDFEKTNQQLKMLGNQTHPICSASSNSSPCSSVCTSTESSDVEVEDQDDIFRRLARQSKVGYKLGQPGQETNKVTDEFTSAESSPRPSSPSETFRQRPQRRCNTCKSWFFVVATNNTKFCEEHKL